MEVNRKFEEVYECAEAHDIVQFNRELYWTLLQNNNNIDAIMEEIYNAFLDSEYCIECNNQQPTRLDLMIVDDGGINIYNKICQDCGTEIELD